MDTMVEDTMDIMDTMDITAIMAITVTLVTIKVIILITDPIFTMVAADILEMVVDFITGRNKKKLTTNFYTKFFSRSILKVLFAVDRICRK